MGSAKQFAHHIHYLRDNERFDIARCSKGTASSLVKLDRLITGSILRSKLVFLINVQPHAAFIEGARQASSDFLKFGLFGKCADTFCRVCGH
jgi:hypothetical protein